MKYLFLTILISFNLLSFGQNDYQSNVCTPKGDSINAWIRIEDNDSVRFALDSIYKSLYPNAIQIPTIDGYSSTSRFNCHGYAWHVADSGSYRWIGYYYNNTDESDYWLKGSYVETNLECFPGKVSWASGDHSAITTNQTGWFISKWNRFPLMKHRWDDSPYGTSNLKYYKLNFSISGSPLLCDNGVGIYTLSNTPGGSIKWSKSTNFNFNSSNTEQSVSVSPNFSGQGYVSVNFKSGCGTSFTLPTHPIWVGIPSNDNLSFGVLFSSPPNNQVIRNIQTYIGVGSNPDAVVQGVTGYRWRFSSWQSYVLGYTSFFNNYSNGTASIKLDYNAAQQQIVTVSAENDCGCDEETGLGKMFYAINYYRLNITANPNPAGSITEVIINDLDEKEQTSSKKATQYNIRIVNSFGLTVYTSKIYQNKFPLSVDNLKEGSYIIHVTDGTKKQGFLHFNIKH